MIGVRDFANGGYEAEPAAFGTSRLSGFSEGFTDRNIDFDPTRRAFPLLAHAGRLDVAARAHFDTFIVASYDDRWNFGNFLGNEDADSHREREVGTTCRTAFAN